MFSYAACEEILNLYVVICRQIGDSVLRFLRNVKTSEDRHIWDGLGPIDKLTDNVCKCHNSAQKEIENSCLYYAKQRVNLEREIIAFAKQGKKSKIIKMW